MSSHSIRNVFILHNCCIIEFQFQPSRNKSILLDNITVPVNALLFVCIKYRFRGYPNSWISILKPAYKCSSMFRKLMDRSA